MRDLTKDYKNKSFDDEKLIGNLDAFISLILKSKPSAVKGDYVKNISVSTTMGPGIKIDINEFKN